METICIANQKGGCGKTVTAINLAAALREKGYRVLLIDIDPQAHATYGLGIDANRLDKSIYNVLTDSQNKNLPLSQTVLNIEDRYDIAPSHILLTTVEQELIDKPDAVLKLTNAMNSVQNTYDYVIIDCPPSLGFLTFNGLRAANLVIVPIEPSYFSMMGVGRLLSMIELLKAKLNYEPSVRALLTMFNHRTNFARKILDDLTKYFGDNLFVTHIRNNMAIREAASKGKTIFNYNKMAKGAEDYLGLADEVIRDAKLREVGRFYRGIDELLSRFLSREKMFRFFAPQAKEVYIVGDFNNWQTNDSCRLDQTKDGSWHRKFFMPPGRHKYKFVVDGTWYNDPENATTESNPFGGVDSILVVE